MTMVVPGRNSADKRRAVASGTSTRRMVAAYSKADACAAVPWSPPRSVTASGLRSTAIHLSLFGSSDGPVRLNTWVPNGRSGCCSVVLERRHAINEHDDPLFLGGDDRRNRTRAVRSRRLRRRLSVGFGLLDRLLCDVVGVLRHQYAGMQHVRRHRITVTDDHCRAQMGHSVKQLREGARQPYAPMRGRIARQVTSM